MDDTEELEELEEEIIAEEPQVQTTSEVATTSGITTLSSGVLSLEAGITTLEDAFPDEIFRTYVAKTVLGNSGYVDSTDSSNFLSASDITTIENITTINVNNMEISSLEGIQHFIGLQELRCTDNNLTELNVSGLVNLTLLNCYRNQLTSLDASGLVSLVELRCQYNNIETINVSNLNDLEWLNCGSNMIEILDLSGLANLTTLYCNANSIKVLDLSQSTKLEIVYCYSNQLTDLNVSGLTNLELLHCYENNLTTLDASGLTSLTSLICRDNELTNVDISGSVNLTYFSCHTNFLTSLDVSDNTKIETFYCYRNQIESLDLSGLTELKIVGVHFNPISELNIEDSAKSNITTLWYRNTNIETMDLSDFTSLSGEQQSLAVTKATNADLSNIKMLHFTGSRAWDDPSLVRLEADAGAFTWDATTGYYVIAPNMNAYYGFGIACENENRVDWVNVELEVSLDEGGLVDNEGNLIVGATLGDVAVDGSITLDSGTIVSPNGTYEFTGSVTIKDGVITTDSEYTFAKNTTSYDEGTDSYVANIGSITTTVIPGEDGVIIDTINNTMEVSAGSVVMNNDGDTSYYIDVAVIDDEGSIVTSGTLITVPSDKVNDITVDGNNITIPAGSTVIIGSESTTYPGSIIINTEDNSIQYLPIDALYNEDGSLKDGVTQEELNSAKDFVNGLEAGSLKDSLQDKVEDAQALYDVREAENAIDNLFDEDGNLKEGITQKDLDNALELINKLPDGDKKDELLEKLEEAQEQYDERVAEENAEKAVDDLFDEDGNLKEGVTQEDIDNAQKEVDKLPEGDKKDELQDKLDEAQKQFDEKEIEKEAEKAVDDLFDEDGNLKEGVTQEDINNAQDAVNKLPEGDKKDELQKEIDKAQDMLNAKEAVGNLFDEDGNLKEGITQKDIDNAQALVDKLPDGTLKDALQAMIDEAQKQLDALNSNPSNPSIATPSGQTTNLSGTSTATVSNVNTGDYTDTALLMGMMIASFAVLGLFAKKRKEAK